MKKIIKQITLSPKNPMIRNHVVYGQEVLPGLSYIDMIYQIFREHGYSHTRLQLRNLSIYHPLTVQENSSIMLNIQCTESEEGRWHITIEGSEHHNSKPISEKKLYVKAEMHTRSVVVFEERLELDQLQPSTKQVDLNVIYEQCRGQELVHTGFMKAEGQVYETEEGILMGISVGQDALFHAEHFMFHPTLMDGSGVGSNLLLSSLWKEEQRLYLPLFYESFCASELLQTHCVTRIQSSSVRQEKELIYLTLEFFNASGKKVAELKNFTSKLVRGTELINPEHKNTFQSAQEKQLIEDSEPLEEASFEEVSANKASSYNVIMEFLQQLLAERLNKPNEQIETQVGYYQMGLDSSSLLQVVEAIEAKIGVNLSPTLLFEYTTIAELSTYLVDNYPEHFSMDSTQLDIEEVTLAISSISPDESDPVTSQVMEEGYRLQEQKDGILPHQSMPTERADIAIIGMAGRYPQASNIQEFWNNLKEGKDCITEIPASRWDWQRFEGVTSPSGKSISKWGGFIDDPDCFDPQFFRISPREAETMDPQERLFLETCWETIEDAGYTPKTLTATRGRNQRQHVGVFVGVMHKDYTLIGAENLAHANVFPLSLNYAQIANRVSYYCNFHGPSMAVDTVCSSSLTAVHLALESIRHGECEVALAGGVNLSLHPHKYMTYGIWDMFSSDGYCRTFGKGGDGYVPGEGIGAVLLKPLHKAVEDGDRIYAVIKGSTINHVGTVSGISVPSPVAQADLIETCLEKTGIDPRTISYVEAHGTGTSLGDPIEIQGLVKAFRQYTSDKQFCSLGSVKSNIGHAESAAGISGLSKVALQLHHKTLVPSLHSEELNPYLDLHPSPFYVQQQMEEWKQPVITENGCEVSYPRRAGVSSFGATGSNAHIILEEYIPETAPSSASVTPMTTASPAIIPLSARNKERLQAYAKKLLAFLHDEIHLSELAYTLQVGREAMEERVAFVVKDVPELIEKLESFVEGQELIKDCWSGKVKNDRAIMNSLSSDQASLVQQSVGEGNIHEIAKLWVQGLSIDWKLLYGETKPQRISLPTYPFEKVRYWVPESDAEEILPRANTVVANFIHPLLHQNISDISGLRFSSTFTGDEFFLSDHVIKGQRVLPGVAYLEMIRAAVEKAVLEKVQARITLKNMIWVRPMAVTDQLAEMHIRLFSENNGEIAYEFYSESEDQEPVVYSQGSVMICSVEEAPTLNIQELQAHCSHRILSSTDCYEAYKKMGIEYGSGHQGIEMVYVGQRQVLARLSMPSSVSHTQDQYVLHPSMMDSALQASIGLRLSSEDPTWMEHEPMLPFALQDMEIFGEVPSSMWVYIRYSEESKAEDPVQKLDLDLCDEQGKVCVRIKGFSSRVLDREAALAETSSTIETLLFEPIWKEQAVTKEKQKISWVENRAMICEVGDIKVGRLKDEFNCIALQSEQSSIHERFQSYATQVFEEIQNILKAKPKGNVLIQIVVPVQNDQRLFSALSGILKTAQLENPKLIGQLIEVEPDLQSEEMIKILDENRMGLIDKQIRYKYGKRYVAEWREIETSQNEINIPWKDQGVYLITGGAGGLGLIFAREMLDQAKGIVLILTGRSPLDNQKKSQLQQLESLGAKVVYKQVDVTQKDAVYHLVKEIGDEYGSLNGIIHSAGVIKDNFIIKKSKKEFHEVLAPKITGLVNVDEATKDMPLDFFILFSSGAGAVGSLGQADYATANAFMNAYGEYRNAQVVLKQRNGRTLSISWPLWKEGGMHVDIETEKSMKQNTGMIAMATEAGIQALYQSWATGKTQVMVVEGVVQQVHSFLRQAAHTRLTDPVIQSTSQEVPLHLKDGENRAIPKITEEALKEKAENYFKSLLSSVIKLPADRIDVNAPMENYGIDSIMIMHLTNELEKKFGSLSKTLFFEYQDIKSITEYFLENYHHKLIDLLGIEEVASSVEDTVKALPMEEESVKSISKNHKYSGYAPLQIVPKEKLKEKEEQDLDIAIIGVSGRYPQADNIHEFWNNLRAGKDCITEIPSDRWDHSLYFDTDKNKPGKTYSKWGGFMNDVDQFDPQFFHISPREAEIMDPQERLFLQCVYETLEDGGYTRDNLVLPKEDDLASHDLGGHVGVYVGVMYEEYQLYGAQEQILGRPLVLTGNPSSIANRVSYYFNFHGPSIALDTMCSSSLTAIHLACQSLQNGECQVAIAGGVNVSIHPNKYLMLGQGKFMSSKGRCESFGMGGDGYVPGEGVGAVLLKPLSKAISDGDQIYGVIKGTAMNHGGKTNGYSVPNPIAQADVIRKSLKKAGVDPRTISYIEAHGTGTSLGDPIEITGLMKVFNEQTQDKQFCAIGSAKSNIGHCESAAGIAGLTKVLLQMKYGQLVPSLHSNVLNPNIDFINTPFIVQQKLEEWKRPMIEVNGEVKEYPRIAGISSFGAGGVNAHVVIEEYIPKAEAEDFAYPSVSTHQNPVIIVLSAKNEERLQERVKGLLTAIGERRYSDTDLPSMAFTLQVGREAMEERLALTTKSITELEEKLKDFVEGKEGIEDLYRGQVKRNKDTLAVFAEDEDMAKTIDAWISKGKYAKLLGLWVKGLSLDWNRLYPDSKPRRISLPTYPFIKERYWFRENSKKAGSRIINEAIEIGIKQPIAIKQSMDVALEKPTHISLQSLSDESISMNQSLEETQHSIPSGLTNVQPFGSMEELHEELTTSLAEVLYMEASDIDVDEKFIDIGMDSITGLEWIKAINKQYGTSIMVTKVYDYPTIRDFAKLLKNEFSKSSDVNNEVSKQTDLSFSKAIWKSVDSPLEKPTHISLQPLSDESISMSHPIEETQYSTPSGSTNVQPFESMEELHEELTTSLAEVLYMEASDIDVDEKFIDIGMDSITGLEWIKAINKQYGTSIMVTKVYDYPTIRDFAKLLKNEFSKSSDVNNEVSKQANQSFSKATWGSNDTPLGKPTHHTSQPISLSPVKQSLKERHTETAVVKGTAPTESIAIVGMSGRYSGAHDLRQFWDNLIHARNSIREIPKSRWDVNQYYDPRPNQKGKIYCKSLGILDDIEHFDPLFFNIPPSEAEVMDPQHRLFLQEGYKAFEDAGYHSQSLSHKKCGVYLGMMSNEYGMMLYQNQVGGSATGNSFAIASARIPYYLNLKGPAISIDTACSSSLVGTHLACQALLNQEIDMALVGGVSLYLTPESYISMCTAGMLSPDGQCKTFDNSANGFVPGEGAGALVLKRLKDAEADQDHIYGVIIGSGINQDGKTNGITAPSANSQMELAREIYEKYQIHPESISYVEMHGTGTKQGDPIELEALSTVFKEKTNQKNYCAIGSVKSNIGHTSAAAGVASVQKVLLCMKNEKLVPTLNFKKPNEHFDFKNSPFYVNTEFKHWEVNSGMPRRACVSSFGYSGTNAHLVIEEYFPSQGDGERTTSVSDTNNPVLVVLSAKKKEQLKAYAQEMKGFVESHESLNLVDLAYTLQVGREAMDYRMAFFVDSREMLQQTLTEFIEDHSATVGILTAQVKQSKDEIKIFETDEDAKKLLQTWIQKKKFKKIAELWVKGLNVDWNKLYSDAKPHRISLPTYPFAKEYYWLPAEKIQTNSSSKTAISTMVALTNEKSSAKKAMCFLKKQWELCPLTSTGKVNRSIAILANKETAKLAVEVSRYFPQHQILDIQNMDLQPSEYDWTSFDGFVDLIGCGRNTNDAVDWIDWLQRLIEDGHREGLMVMCVTKGLESYQNDSINLSGASRAGLYRMLQNEYSHVKSRHMDADACTEDQVLAQQIANEFSANDEHAEVCYRDGKRYRACLKEWSVEDHTMEKISKSFPEEHVLLITGGTRGLGYLCAKHFIEHYGVKRLVLTGRESLPPREQWDVYKESNTLIEQKIQAVLDLEAQGATVEVLSLPLSDSVAVQQRIQYIRNTMGPIGGVIHCAGVGDLKNPAFIKKKAVDIQHVLEPKITGLHTLFHLLHNEPLQFFVLYSSVSGIIPVLASGQSAYAMANAYMDYFAEATKDHCPIISIQWPNWKETGMGEVKSRAYEQTGLLSMTNEEGLQFLDQILSQKMRSVILPAVHSDRWNPEQFMQREIQENSTTDTPLWHSAPIGVESHELVDVTQAWLIELFSKELKIDPTQLEIDEPFQEYGVDSIILAQLLQQINQKLLGNIDPSTLYEYPTIQSFAVWLVGSYGDSLSKALDGLVSEKPAPVHLPTSLEKPISVQEQQKYKPSHVISNEEDMAIVGLSCSFPGADTLEKYWDLLSKGKSAIHPVPQERWGYSNSYYAGLIDNITHFDPEFFRIPEDDAKVMDPQALAVLEQCLYLWYHSGYSHHEIKGRPIGVYLGGRSQHKPNESQLLQVRNPIVATGQNYLATNISQFFDLRGPSVVLDTACSSSLVGMNMAIQALRSGEIESAVVGGVSLLDTDVAHQMFQQRGILCNEPSFHVFDQRADGVVLGEGVGMVLVKTVSQAIQDGDSIYAVIKAIAVNNDGRTAGPATPNLQAQKDVMQVALDKSGKQPEEISYIEANGSGSTVTDLLELKAIQSIYRSSNKVPLGIGSVKPNIGHPLCAEGIASLIKVVLMLQHRQWVPFLSGEQSMTHFDIEASSFYFCRKSMEWTEKVPIAAINCFADGGTNAHVILEAWEETTHRAVRKPLPLPALKRQPLLQIGLLSKEDQAQAVQLNTTSKGMFWKTLI
ncbi:SDR family NAD(P)-dependent oxidoreductase [Hazenella coriacea]|uniref:Polyketide synthase PksL n=1 Tax=Hazenella coriacea TaxID=1179467 RepID=A0A4V2UUX9_9BACL|nr:SDR family NAD(P)-dependent oxidoreductase [Hazenella coriacea]TCS93647.1 polyketide synthase PksL [Hazenella coriacea]